LMIST